MLPIHHIYPKLATPANVIITTHQKPDPDALGSSLALSQVLLALGHSVTVISPTNWAAFLDWMPGAEAVLNFEITREKSASLINAADWIFCLDFNTLSRTKNLAPVLEQATAAKVLIDHHQQPAVESFAYGISDITKSSTCEMIYDFIIEGGWENLLTVDVAACLYAGLIGDTGSFRFPAASANVHKMAAHLKETGLKHTKVHEHIYDNFMESRLRFIGFVLTSRMEVYYEYNTALIYISKNDLLRYDIKTGDTEGLVNYPLSIGGIKMAAICIDRDEERKWSFRSKGNVDVNTFARRFFEGGGHFNAAGGRSSASLEETVKTFKKVLKENASEFQLI
ncbi:bifunctional oligoribonuclease/PAP phosphatase NrnA [Flavihumibacter sp. CACIAM 22H1]|uniref:DHH family phosphoesterase n=1 Tax=Flavihumibacter sp. CACIAM 22H1 TaxID=1812911 RepID=UPI0007A81D43|nr:bifunctional oligoribonuclease/PAP phosphatase NrnA [Flavihumibacter sp. CACIAM 22H1]KYP14832.1 MAG: exopolyphosphatase [Flavihumibacter sp. CACIAM 22H1]